MPSAKRSADSNPLGPGPGPGPGPKTPKSEPDGSQEGFSAVVKKKLMTSSRTGQACDRCKIRKIRCDAKPGGCSPCQQNNTECVTTDRITGRATSRGHTETIEHENQYLRQAVLDLQQQLRDNGVDVKPANGINGYVPAGWPQPGQPNGPQMWDAGQGMNNANQVPYENNMGEMSDVNVQEKTVHRGALLPAFRAGCKGDNYLGVSSANDYLSPIKGTSLALYGMEIDLAEFMPSSLDDPSSSASYQHFLDYAFKKRLVGEVPLPPRQECEMYAQWYFRSINPFTPILHKPAFMSLLATVYEDPRYHPTAAETVMVHMMLAILRFQLGARNADRYSLEQSDVHYRYALGHLHSLVSGHTLQDVQALSLVCAHLRSLPKPGAAWMVTNLTISIAIELGLHRSAKAWVETAPKKDNQEVELRKRIFWSLLTIHVSLSGKLGRPMPLRMEDIDVEFPEPVHDNLPSDGMVSDWQKCSFRVGLQAMKIIALLVQMYSTVYALRQSSTSYEMALRRLQRELQQWHDQIPPELSGGPNTHEADRMFALYLSHWECEFQLLLHHPALCRSSSAQVMARNLDVCVDSSERLLHSVVQLRNLKSLDTTWGNCVVYLAAIFTTLFAYSERKDQITSAELTRLREDMNLWLDVMGDAGALLAMHSMLDFSGNPSHCPPGTGNRLQLAIRNIVDAAVGEISRHLATKTASAAVATANMAASSHSPERNRPHQSQSQDPYGAPYHSHGFPTAHTNNTGINSPSTTTYLPPDDPSLAQNQGAYPTTTHYAYPEPSSVSVSSYPQSAVVAYEVPQPPYSVATGADQVLKPDVSAHLAAPLPQSQPMAPPPNTYMFGSPPTQAPYAGGPIAWRQFTEGMVDHLGPHEYLTSANALMALGGRDAQSSGVGDVGASAVMPEAGVGAQSEGQSWPLMTYDNGAGLGQ
ncbi:hypothetical protein B0A49_07950 [Cryomyces minteri]|uniref:Zn(2)-C6 fungal-type domain-containing protein n=1 Tax=Cryomyces minteri TaxID=331657 RepID=A0A4U0XAC8_9PEZI|nr:hypothetical protein B0A49_07950 [Cryomyces minteri]